MASPKVNPSTNVVSFNSSPSVSVTFDQPSWWEKIFVSAEYEQDIGDQIQAGAQSALNSLVDFQVPSVNTFAVANLLFPSLQIMSFQSANVPGDLIVFGALQNTSLSATPVYVTLTGGGTQQFEANQAVNWSIPKQGATTGSISQFGLYTAPSKVASR